MAEIFRAIEPFAYTDKNGIPRIVTPGDDPVAAGDPVLKGKEHLFRTVDVSGASETASAGPGERRSRSKRLRNESRDDTSSNDDEKDGSDGE